MRPCLGPRPGDVGSGSTVPEPRLSSIGVRPKPGGDRGLGEGRLGPHCPGVVPHRAGGGPGSVRTHQLLKGRPAPLVPSFKLSLSKARVVLLFVFIYFCFLPLKMIWQCLPGAKEEYERPPRSSDSGRAEKVRLRKPTGGDSLRGPVPSCLGDLWRVPVASSSIKWGYQSRLFRVACTLSPGCSPTLLPSSGPSRGLARRGATAGPVSQAGQGLECSSVPSLGRGPTQLQIPVICSGGLGLRSGGPWEAAVQTEATWGRESGKDMGVTTVADQISRGEVGSLPSEP